MRIQATILGLLLTAAVPASPALAQSHAGHADMVAPATPQLLSGYGGGGLKIDTQVPQAQAFFDNGLQLAAAFAHAAAVEAMKEARRLDPACAMCVWGVAWADGPTINYNKTPEEMKGLLKLAREAQAMAAKGGDPLEKALTDALVVRYTKGGGWGQPGDLAFADAMQKISDQHPDNDQIASFAADAWLQAGSEDEAKMKAAARRSMAAAERVLGRNPTYTPAIHFYIHASEIAGEPAKAEPFANRLGALAPNAQHLVHMPSHTFYWVGRYREAGLVNRQAVEIVYAQAKAMAVPPPAGVFGVPYHLHNVTFGIGGALMAGDAETALWLARPLVTASLSADKALASSQRAAAGAYVALGILADPREILAVPEPRLPMLKGMWHYARGEAFARLGRAADVRREQAAIPAAPEPKRKKDDYDWYGRQTLRIASAVLDGRAAMIEGKPALAAAAFERGSLLQEDADYGYSGDPPAWWSPVRRFEAEARLAGGDLAGAKQSADKALKGRPLDPGSLAVLAAIESRRAAR
ncbi:hypothetical protein [Sphingomonas rosea]